MTNEEFRDYVDSLRTQDEISYDVYSGLIDGIDTLEQESCANAINRQVAIDESFEVDTKEYGRIEVVGIDAINSLPPVTLQQSCEDSISIQAVYELSRELVRTTRGKFDFLCKFWEELGKLPSVTLQPKIGRWIPLEYDGYADGNPAWDKWECSECGWEHSGDRESLTAFCPNCGVRMEVEDNG